MAQPVPQRDEAAQGPDVRRREGDARVDGAQGRGGEVEHEVVGPDRDDRAVDLAQSAQQLDPDPLARVMSLHTGRNDEQPVGAHERGQHARAARQRGGDDPVPDPAEPHPDPVVHADRGRQLPGEVRGRRRAFPRCGAFQLGEQRRGEDVERERGRHRIAGHADHRRAVDGAEHHRVARPDGDAVDREGPGSGDDTRGVVVAAGAGARDEQDEVGVRGRGAHGRGDGVRVVRHDPGDRRRAARLTRLRREHERVGVEDVARFEAGADRADLVAGRDHRHDGRAADRELGRPGRGARGDIHRAQAMPLRQQQLGGADVLADRPDVLVGRDGGAQLGPVAGAVDVLAHDHRVVAGGQRVAGVDDLERVRLEQHRGGLRGADRVGRAHGDAVHPRRVERRG